MFGYGKRLGAVALAVALLTAGAPSGALALDGPRDSHGTGKSDSYKPIGAGSGRRNA
jgi:hypothetical protein